MQRKQSGFTLIELVIVIVVLGILASFAVPRIGDLVERARISKVQALSGSVKVAATIAHAQQIAEQVGASTGISMNGNAVTMDNRYPDLAGIDDALAEFDGFTYDSATGEFTLDNSGATADGANCSVTYAVPGALGETPTVSIDITDCK